MKPEPLFLEVATPFAPENIFSFRRSYDTTSQILHAEASEGRSFTSVYDLFNDMEDKDAHLYSVLQTRKNGILSKERKIIAASENPQDQEVARFVQESLFSIPNFENSLMNLLDAIAKGFAVLEVIWAFSSNGLKISELKSRFQGRFIFDEQNQLKIIDPPISYINYIKKNPSTSPHLLPAKPASERVSPAIVPSFTYYPPSPYQNPSKILGYPVPPQKFIVFSFNSQNENPYGRGLCLKAYWYYWFKKNNLKFWVIFNEKFGSPTVIGKYRPGASQEEKTKLFEVIESLQNDTGVMIPETVAIEFLEAKRSGAVNSYKDLADWCNDEISKLVLGQTLTSIEGRRSGSLALGKVHEKVRLEYIESDARALSELVNSTLIPWLVDYNFSNVKKYPKFIIDTSDSESLDREIEIDKSLINIGVPIPIKHFYEKYKRPAPLGGERSLRYDDNNLYQYHLQFGVLTINEIRASLGLQPVPWGDTPPTLPNKTQPSPHIPPQSIRNPQEEIQIKEQIIDEKISEK